MDLITRLHDLQCDHPTAPADTTVGADLARGRQALARRRVRRSVTAGAGVLAVAGLTTALAVGTAAPPRRADALPTHQAQSQRRLAAPAITLVDYTGPQRHGFDVAKIPDGWVLQDSQPGYLTVAPADDHTDGASFVDKLVVMLRSVDDHGPLRGTPVTVNGHRGGLADSHGTRTLSYLDGSHIVDVQAWKGLAITDEQLIAFAEGITVTADVTVSRG